MLILGLTGNIGCGKSSITNIFRKNKIDVIDADVISREIFDDKKLLQEVFDCFGNSIINLDKTLNRKVLGKIVFNDDSKLLELNNLTHPRIKEKIFSQIKKIKSQHKKIVVIDAALLIEGGYLEVVDKVVVVTCSENIQIERIKYRDKCSQEEALNRIKSQIPQIEKLKYADYLIDNSGSVDELEINTEKFIKYMKEKWCE